MTYIIVDIDGTCADLSHRLHYIKGAKKDYVSFLSPSEVEKDLPNKPLRDLLLSVHDCEGAGEDVIYVSGRPESLRNTTMTWLNKHVFPSAACSFFRPDGDLRPDHIVKKEIYTEQIFPTWGTPSFVIDDRPQVVEMWRSLGLSVLALAYNQETPSLKNRGLLTLMVGPSGAGKSHILEENERLEELAWSPGSGEDLFYSNLSLEQLGILNRCPNDNRIVLSSDDFRQMMFGDRSDQSHNEEVFQVLHANAVAMLAAGCHVIIDATHLRRKDRLAAVALAQGGPVRYIVVDRPNKTPWHGNLEVVKKHEQIFRSQLKDILAGDNLPNVTVYDWRVK